MKTRWPRIASVLLRLAIIALLLVLPVLALRGVPIDLRWIAAVTVAVNVITLACYARDKRCAETDSWRISEARLHLLELLGGWPGAWLAQLWLRHKTSKASYQLTFWLIILLHQAVAYDALQGWRWIRHLAR